MAANRAPMVVGIRHTKSATRVGTSVPKLFSGSVMPRYPIMYCSAFQAMGHSGTTTIRKIRVNADSTSVSAISFGVRCRMAPSTSAIIRSRNESPLDAVMRTTMRSESTSVPPVTPERSPPASRMTGADSPVIDDSSTEAMPSIISPSPGMTCPVSTTTRSPILKAAEEISSMAPFGASRRAGVSRRVRRNDSACAFPRASASAVAKLANNTVKKSQASSAMK